MQVQQHPDNVEAWRLLGNVHAENDDDTQAIQALRKALAVDPSNAEVIPHASSTMHTYAQLACHM